MGEKDTQESYERMISLGILKPKDIANYPLNTIYVNIKRDRSNICTKAFSYEEFMYHDKKVKEASNIIGHSRHDGGAIYSSYWDFIKNLETENNAKLDKNRLFEDALDAKKFLEEINGLSGKRLELYNL